MAAGDQHEDLDPDDLEDEEDLDEGEDEDENIALWKGVVEELLAKGASPAEAIDGANLVLQAYKRDRQEAAARRTMSENVKRSGVRRRSRF